jgi:3',5'-cyclic AMP phosphodiesterase CpdA
LKQSLKYLFSFLLLIITGAASGQILEVPPYIQPGNASDLHHEKKVVIWQTDSTSAHFTVEFRKGKNFDEEHGIHQGKVERVKLEFNGKVSWLYRAYLDHLEFDHDYAYRVKAETRLFAQNSFRTRTHHHKTKFAALGDCGTGSPGQAAVAYQIFQRKPDFALLTGDLVYSNGQASEYKGRFFQQYLAPVATINRGGPLMQQIPFYTVLGNHDIRANDLREHADGMAYFYYMDLPRNGPDPGYAPEVLGSSKQLAAFKERTADRHPKISNYSFRHGNVHMVVLDANTYVNPQDTVLTNWLRKEFKHHKNEWRIVSYHHPAFNSSNAHYYYQVMRVLSPLFEELGVDLVLTGHVHNYQRTHPLKFVPEKDKKGRWQIGSDGRVDGTFTLDQKFDGKTVTKPDGIIYVVTGAGGAQLYDAEISNKPSMWEHSPRSNWVPYTTKLISDVHSFTWVETDGHVLKLSQIDSKGNLLDEITMTR